MRRIWPLFVLITLFVSLASSGSARAADAPGTQPALAWLLARQQDDGSFPGFDAGASADAVFAITAAGIDPNGVLKNGNSPISYLGNQAGSYATKSVAGAAKLTLAVIAADKDPLAFGGQNLVALVLAGYDAKTGLYGATPTDHAYALLALAAAGQPILPQALDALARTQLVDGGWSFDGTVASGSDTNTTALAVQALVATGTSGDMLASALAYLRSQQNTDGGFPYSKNSPFGSASDANSTAVTIQAFAAAGQDARALAQNGGDPMSALLALQNASGAFRYQAAFPDDNDLATAQAIPALLLRPLPLKKVSLAPVQMLPVRLPTTSGAAEPLVLLGIALGMCLAGMLIRRRQAS